MTEPPGTLEAAYLSFAILDELLTVLIANNVLTKADIATLLDTVSDRVSKSTSYPAKPSARVLRQMIAEKKRE